MRIVGEFHVGEDGLMHGAAVIDDKQNDRWRYLELYSIKSTLRFFSIGNL